MALKPTIRVGETGKTLLCSTGIDLTGATELEMKFLKSNETTTVSKKTGDGVTDNGAPTAGQLKWVNTDIFDQYGGWKVIAIVTFTSGFHKSEPAEFTVKQEFEK